MGWGCSCTSGRRMSGNTFEQLKDLHLKPLNNETSPRLESTTLCFNNTISRYFTDVKACVRKIAGFYIIMHIYQSANPWREFKTGIRQKRTTFSELDRSVGPVGLVRRHRQAGMAAVIAFTVIS